MFYFNFILVTLLFWAGGINEVYEKNKLIEEAEKLTEKAQKLIERAQIASNAKDYQKAKEYHEEARGYYREAKENYSRLVNDFDVRDEAIKLNLANAHFYLEKEQMQKNNQSQPTVATDQKFAPFKISKKYYSELSLSQNKKISSTAYNQLGIIESMNATDSKSANSAIEQFKEALKQNPDNDLARYNYEVMIRQQAQQQNQSDNKNDENNKQEKENRQKQQAQSDKASDAKQQEQQKGQQTDKNKDSKVSRDAMLRAIERKPIDYPKIQRFKPKNNNKKSKNW